jgi:hypothetical protein
MSYSRRQCSIPATARELFDMHSGIGVVRHRTDTIEVFPMYPFSDTPPLFIGLRTMIDLAQERRRSTLALLGYQVDKEVETDTQLFFPYPGSIDTPDRVIQGMTPPESVINMASAGIDLLNGYIHLPPDERRALASIPYGNEKVFDFSDTSGLQSSAIFIVAKALLLLEPPVET